MKRFLVLGLLVAAGIAVSSANENNEPGFYEQLLRAVKEQEKALQGKDFDELAVKLMEQARTIGKEFMGIFRDAMTAANAADGDKARRKRDTGKADITSLIQQLLAAQQGNSAAEPASQEVKASEDAATKQGDQGSGGATVSGRVGPPAPIVLIPGPPGKPGVPGVPGIPGKAGKIPNFRGLKAIITTRVAELLAFLAFLAVAAIAKFLGLLGLLLGLVLPVYGKLKSAGALVPAEMADPGYGQPTDPYGAQPESPYGRRKRAVPVDMATSGNMAAFVLKSLESARSKYQ